MSAPYVPQNVILQTGNGNNLVSWDMVVGATTYLVQRSLDGNVWLPVATVTNNLYLDPAAGLTVGTNYYYRVASQSGTGFSAYRRGAGTWAGAAGAARAGRAAGGLGVGAWRRRQPEPAFPRRAGAGAGGAGRRWRRDSARPSRMSSSENRLTGLPQAAQDGLPGRVQVPAELAAQGQEQGTQQPADGQGGKPGQDPRPSGRDHLHAFGEQEGQAAQVGRQGQPQHQEVGGPAQHGPLHVEEAVAEDGEGEGKGQQGQRQVIDPAAPGEQQALAGGPQQVEAVAQQLRHERRGEDQRRQQGLALAGTLPQASGPEQRQPGQSGQGGEAGGHRRGRRRIHDPEEGLEPLGVAQGPDQQFGHDQEGPAQGTAVQGRQEPAVGAQGERMREAQEEVQPQGRRSARRQARRRTAAAAAAGPAGRSPPAGSTGSAAGSPRPCGRSGGRSCGRGRRPPPAAR